MNTIDRETLEKNKSRANGRVWAARRMLYKAEKEYLEASRELKQWGKG